jgi:hypothetical protein
VLLIYLKVAGLSREEKGSYWFPLGWVEREKEEASKLVILLGREGRLGIGREERGGAADPPQEGKEDGEGSTNSKSRNFIFPLVERQGRERELLIFS